MRRLCSLIGDRRVDREGRLTVRWPKTCGIGLSQATDKVV
jgi:hypothetical protein